MLRTLSGEKKCNYVVSVSAILIRLGSLRFLFAIFFASFRKNFLTILCDTDF